MVLARVLLNKLKILAIVVYQAAVKVSILYPQYLFFTAGLYNTINTPIILDNNEPNAEELNTKLNATISNNNNNKQTLIATLLANCNNSYTSPPAIPTKSLIKDYTISLATSSTANGVSNNYNYSIVVQ